MTTKIPPCPVCGVAPPMVNEFWLRSCACETVEGGPRHTPPDLWVAGCERVLGRALRSHGIETVAQVDDIVHCTKDKYYHDVLLARDFWCTEHANLATANAALQSRITELEGELANARGEVERMKARAKFVIDRFSSDESDKYNGPFVQGRIWTIIDAAAPAQPQEVKG